MAEIDEELTEINAKICEALRNRTANTPQTRELVDRSLRLLRRKSGGF